MGNNRGFTLIENLSGLGLLAIVLLAAIGGYSAYFRQTKINRDQLEFIQFKSLVSHAVSDPQLCNGLVANQSYASGGGSGSAPLSLPLGSDFNLTAGAVRNGLNITAVNLEEIWSSGEFSVLRLKLRVRTAGGIREPAWTIPARNTGTQTVAQCLIDPALAAACPAGKVLVGFDAQGGALCQALTAVAQDLLPNGCPAGCYLLGIVNGQPACRGLPSFESGTVPDDPPPCPSMAGPPPPPGSSGGARPPEFSDAITL
ncbi:MAG: prepilin-type N-terminal cleavage/methylation domain-containing protein [Bacteriovoracia bacterium]